MMAAKLGWSERDVCVLGRLCPAKIAARLHRTERAVNEKARRIGLKRGARGNSWTSIENASASIWRTAGMPIAEIARRLGRTPTAVLARLEKLREPSRLMARRRGDIPAP